MSVSSLPTKTHYETAPYKHSEAAEFFSSVVEEFVVWSKPQQLRLAVRAAIAAYEKSGKMLDAALVLAAHGFPVFPLTVGKTPVPKRDKDAKGKPIPGTGSFKKATCDPIQIRTWWTGHEYLIGLPMGEASGVWCLDIDTSEDHADGVAKWKTIAAEHDPIVTREHRSATGGPHLIFNWKEEKLNGCSSGDLPDGIDVKGDGSYIVVPPSRRKGRSYSVFNDIDPIDTPEWLSELILRGRSRFDGTYSGGITAEVDEVREAMTFIPNDDEDWEEWKSMALRLYAALGDEGFKLFDDWSLLSIKYDAEKTLEAWEQVQSSPPTRTGVEKIFKMAREHGWVRKAKPTYSDEGTHSAEGARDETRRRVREFLRRIGVPESERNVWIDFYFEVQKHLREGEWYPTKAYAMLVPTGIGKTTITVEELIVWLHTVTVGPIIYAVPYHKLGSKIEERFAGHGLNVRTFLGRGRPDPLKHDPTKSKDDQIKMCINPEPVAVAVKCRMPVSESCCKNGKMKCPFFDPGPEQCGYQRQYPEKDEKVDVWIVASDMLFKKQKVLGEPAAVIIDEAIWRKGLRGVEQKKEDALAIDSLMMRRRSVEELPAGAAPAINYFTPTDEELRILDRAHSVRWRDWDRDKLRRALMQQVGNGGVEREHLAKVFSVQECDEIIRHEWKLLPKLELQPGMSKGAIEKFDPDLIDEIVHTRRVIRIWRAVRELVESPEIEVSGRLTLKQSNGQRVVTCRGVAQINKQFQVPTLMFDATLPALEVLQVYYPLVEVVADIKVEMPPHVRVRQVLDAPTTSRKLINAKLKDPEQHLKEMLRYIWKRWMETGKRETLVVCQEKVEDWFEGKLPAGITVIHYNDLAGLDDFKLVRLLILIGRVAPGPEAVEALAGAMSGAQPTLVPPNPSGFTWYPQVSRSIRLRDGSGHVVDRCDKHPDAFGDDVRWLICEAELIQAFGRARGINRTDDEPLDIDILTNVVLPVTVDEVRYWKKEAPSLLFETAMTEGVMLTSEGDMVKLWPHIWKNDKAAYRTVQQGVPVLPDFVPVTYQVVGPKMKRRQGWFDLRVIPDPKAWLIAHLGELAFFEARAPGTLGQKP